MRTLPQTQPLMPQKRPNAARPIPPYLSQKQTFTTSPAVIAEVTDALGSTFSTSVRHTRLDPFDGDAE
jgi:hypothetical protein